MDDEANLRKVLSALLARDGHRATAVDSAEAALARLAAPDADYNLVITDLKMPGIGGLGLLQAVKASQPGLPVIVITAHGSVDTAVSALKLGAFDYVTKPFERAELRLAVRKAAAVAQTARRPSTAVGSALGRFGMVGMSRAIQEVYGALEKVADSPATVLITGESGTGKELVATALHEHSSRSKAALIRVNCGAIPDDLMESEFFGYEQGAFTGAVGQKPGRFELADGGTLFLDEIGELSLPMQAKLLRVLQNGEFERVGGVRTLKVDTRLVAATNQDLQAAIARGAFRQDLFYRLNVVPLALPPLRQRSCDVEALARYFVAKANVRLSSACAGFDQEATACLRRYPFPGNVRELENLVERAVLFAEGPTLTVATLPPAVRALAATGDDDELAHELTPDSFRARVRQETRDVERDLIVRALAHTQGNVTHAAAHLQLSRKGLQNKMKELGLRGQAAGEP